MILKYSLISFFVFLFITASDPFFGVELTWKKPPPDEISDVVERLWFRTDAFHRYITDYDNRVSDLFPVDPYFYPNVQFWFLIYTQFESSAVVIHDKTDLSIIYKVLDFSSLHKKELPRNTIYILQDKIAEDKVEELKRDLDELAMNPFSLSTTSKHILRTLKQAGITLPDSKSDRSIFFTELKKNLRTQTGQKNFIKSGIMESLPYQAFLFRLFNDKKLPKELLAIPFLESSFNPRAHSKVSAAGAWQFMPLISSYYLPKRGKNLDYRFNVGLSSVAAAKLLSENHRILKSWDLAVTAYNSGTKHLLKTKRELNRGDVSLEDIIKHSDSKHFGFASKNFYSEFLALIHTLAYQEELFDGLHAHDRSDVNEELKYFITKCSVRIDKALGTATLDDVHFHNHQLLKSTHTIPRGYLLTAKSLLPPSKFFHVPYKELLRTKPKDWDSFLRNQSCSTR